MSVKKRFEAKLTQRQFNDVKSVINKGDFETNHSFLIEAAELLDWAIDVCKDGHHISAVSNGSPVKKYESRQLRHLYPD